MFNLARAYHQLGEFVILLYYVAHEFLDVGLNVVLVCVCEGSIAALLKIPLQHSTAGIMHAACHFYKQVLITEPECKLPQVSTNCVSYAASSPVF